MLLSLETVAVSVTVAFPFTVVDEAETETPMRLEPPPVLEPLPQPERQRKATMVITNRLTGALVLRPEGRDLDLDIWRPFNVLDESWRDYTESKQM